MPPHDPSASWRSQIQRAILASERARRRRRGRRLYQRASGIARRNQGVHRPAALAVGAGPLPGVPANSSSSPTACG